MQSTSPTCSCKPSVIPERNDAGFDGINSRNSNRNNRNNRNSKKHIMPLPKIIPEVVFAIEQRRTMFGRFDSMYLPHPFTNTNTNTIPNQLVRLLVPINNHHHPTMKASAVAIPPSSITIDGPSSNNIVYPPISTPTHPLRTHPNNDQNSITCIIFPNA